jgi:uncharacterized membrane protein YfcA
MAAAFGGGLVDSIAGGGGLITLPVLLAAGLPPHVAIATNKGQGTPGALSSCLSFWLRGGVDRSRAGLGFAAGFAGALAGAYLLTRVAPGPLRPIVIALLVVAAIALVLRRPTSVPQERTPSRPRLSLAAIAGGCGAYDGFFGPGTGSFLILAFNRVFGDSLVRASGNAKVVNLASNLAALSIFAARGTVLWSVALPMAAANVAGAALGARLAMTHGDRLVRALVLVVLTALLVKIVLDGSGR